MQPRFCPTATCLSPGAGTWGPAATQFIPGLIVPSRQVETAEDAPRRLAQCARQSTTVGNLTMAELCRIIADLRLIVVHVSLKHGPRGPQRRVTQIVEVYDALDDLFKRHELFSLDANGQLRWAEPDLSDATWERLRAEKIFLPVYGRAGSQPARGGRR